MSVSEGTNRGKPQNTGSTATCPAGQLHVLDRYFRFGSSTRYDRGAKVTDRGSHGPRCKGGDEDILALQDAVVSAARPIVSVKF
jgi:hypothetical protein